MKRSILFLVAVSSIIPLALVAYVRYLAPGPTGLRSSEAPAAVRSVVDSLRAAAFLDSLVRAERAKADSIEAARERANVAYAAREEEMTRLSALRLELEQNRQELDALKNDLTGLVERTKAPADSNVVRLVKLYEAMKPQKAASIMDALSDPMIIEILPRMKKRQAAKILSAITPPARGARLTRMMSEVRY